MEDVRPPVVVVDCEVVSGGLLVGDSGLGSEGRDLGLIAGLGRPARLTD